MKPLTQTRLKQLLEYNPSTGTFVWLKRCGSAYPRNLAGSARTSNRNTRPYHYINIDGMRYPGHHLAWLYMTGETISGIDHINRNGMDNRWHNLRRADASQNKANMGKQSNNTVGLKGVTRHRQKFQAQIQWRKEYRYLGVFATAEAAHAAYCRAAKELFGEFGRTE